MITRAALWVSHTKLMHERVGGMTVLERQLWTLARAGVLRVSVAARRPAPEVLEGLRLPKELEILWMGAAAAPEDEEAATPPYVGVSGDHFVRVETLRYVLNAPYPVHTDLQDDLKLSVLQVVPFRSEETIAPKTQALPAGASVFLEPAALPGGPAVDWLLAMGFKNQDGFMAKHFDRHISLAISRGLLAGPVTPNLMTVASSLIGLFGAALFAWAPAHDALAASLVWAHSVLDGCDGELARIRFQESDFGATIDFWGDNLVHLALFGALAFGYARAGHAAAPFLGLAAALGIAGSAIVAFRRKRSERHAAPEPNAGPLRRLCDFLAQRDFIYLLLAMAFLDKTYGFLWAGAVGAPLFFVIMLAAGQAGDSLPGGEAGRAEAA